MSSTVLPPSRQVSIGLGFASSMMGKGVPNSFNPMENFGTGGASKLSSEGRFNASSRATSVSGLLASSSSTQWPWLVQLAVVHRLPGNAPVASKERRGTPTSLVKARLHPSLCNIINKWALVVPLHATANRWDRKTFQARLSRNGGA
jgi:hypothetical protein